MQSVSVQSSVVSRPPSEHFDHLSLSLEEFVVLRWCLLLPMKSHVQLQILLYDSHCASFHIIVFVHDQKLDLDQVLIFIDELEAVAHVKLLFNQWVAMQQHELVHALLCLVPCVQVFMVSIVFDFSFLFFHF